MGVICVGKTGAGRVVTTVMPPSTDVVKVLDENDVRIVATPEDSGMPSFFSILLSWFPMLLFIGIWIFFMRQMQEDLAVRWVRQVTGKIAD